MIKGTIQSHSDKLCKFAILFEFLLTQFFPGQQSKLSGPELCPSECCHGQSWVHPGQRNVSAEICLKQR